MVLIKMSLLFSLTLLYMGIFYIYI